MRMRTVLVLGREGIGEGNPEVGMRILGLFLRKSPAIKELEAIVLFNNAVRLVTEGSPLLAELRLLHESGVEICPCGTCLDHYGLSDKVAVGETSNMDTIIAEIDKADKVITL